jgi:hypothetical protein
MGIGEKAILPDHTMWYFGKMVGFKFFLLGLPSRVAEGLGKNTKLAFIVLTCNENASTAVSDDSLQQELERTIRETRTIDGKWTIDKVTVLEDP